MDACLNAYTHLLSDLTLDGERYIEYSGGGGVARGGCYFGVQAPWKFLDMPLLLLIIY